MLHGYILFANIWGAVKKVSETLLIYHVFSQLATVFQAPFLFDGNIKSILPLPTRTGGFSLYPIVENQGFRKRDVAFPPTIEKPGTGWRRRKLHILRFRLPAKAHLFRCASSFAKTGGFREGTGDAMAFPQVLMK